MSAKQTVRRCCRQCEAYAQGVRREGGGGVCRRDPKAVAVVDPDRHWCMSFTPAPTEPGPKARTKS